jgi:predicted transcriptional regulator YdeE
MKVEFRLPLFLGFFLSVAFGIIADGQQTTNRRKDVPITRADLPAFTVIGIEARTTNAKEATGDGIIPKQWQKFFQEGVLGKIPNKASQNIYALYTKYASDRNGEYNFVIGAMVKDGTVAPVGMVTRHVPAAHYLVLTSEKGVLRKVVPDAWLALWKLEDEGKLKRAYQTDFEIYDQRSEDPQSAQVDIYIGLK